MTDPSISTQLPNSSELVNDNAPVSQSAHSSSLSRPPSEFLGRINVKTVLSAQRLLENDESGHIHKRRRVESDVLEDSICEECRTIDFERVVELDSLRLQNTGEGIYITEFGMRLSRPPDNNCKLCRLFFEIKIPAGELSESSGYELRACSYLKHNPSLSFKDLPSKLRRQDLPCLVVVAKGTSNESLVSASRSDCRFLICLKQSTTQQCLLTPQLVPPQPDFSALADWLGYCKDYHKKLCKTTNISLQGMRVLDCNSMTIIPTPPECLYAALSYVWGRSDSTSDNWLVPRTDGEPILRASLPRVISDAITVTKELGLNYLWLNKFCIDQNNPKEKHEQICQMDTIYRQAEFTIIAAAGEDETFGLPGIGATFRQAQQVVQVNTFQIIPTIAHPHTTIPSSKWATRGWTYQEAVLSRRRLVFTKEQVYFECNAMNCSESVRVDFNLAHAKGKNKALLFMHSGIFTGAERFRPQDEKDQDVVANVESYFEHIQQYSKRHLSFESDSFKAFAGVANHFQHSKNAEAHTWGMPLLPVGPHTLTVQNLIATLYWKHKNHIGSHLPNTSRRPAFPSWSWTGWAGEVEFLSTTKMLRETRSLRLSMDVTPLSRLMESLESSALLEMFAYVVPPLLISAQDSSTPSLWKVASYIARLSLSIGTGSGEEISKRLASGSWKVIKVFSQPGNLPLEMLHPHFLVTHSVQVTGTDCGRKCCERVGLMSVEALPNEMKTLLLSCQVESVSLI